MISVVHYVLHFLFVLLVHKLWTVSNSTPVSTKLDYKFSMRRLLLLIMQNCISFFHFEGVLFVGHVGWFLRNAGKSLKLIKRRANIYSPHILGSATCMISACQSLFGFLFVVMCVLQPCLMQTLNNQSVPFFCVETYSQESNYYNVNTCCNVGIGICADITWLSTLLTTNWLVTTYGLPIHANVPNVEPLWYTIILVYCSRQFHSPFWIFCNFQRCSPC